MKERCSRSSMIHVRAKLQLAEGVRRGAVAQHDERRGKTTRATRFRRVALFAGRPGGTGKKVKGREIDVAPGFCTGTCASKAANHWQATAPRRAPVALWCPLDRVVIYMLQCVSCKPLSRQSSTQSGIASLGTSWQRRALPFA